MMDFPSGKYGMMSEKLGAPFPYFGGKRDVADYVWRRFGKPKHYIEPFCGSMAILLANPEPCSLEVVNDYSGFIANFWRATKYQPAEVAQWADYPVSHVDLGARHDWMMAQREQLAERLKEPEWPGDAKIAGWWLWGQCCWIGSGWCEWDRVRPNKKSVPHIGSAGLGIQAIGQVPHISNAGKDGLLTSSGRAAWVWLHELAQRLDRVRIIHGDWKRCLNNNYGRDNTAVFLDPPYHGRDHYYGATEKTADAVAEWARANANMKIAVCGNRGDYEMPGWHEWGWSRKAATYGSTKTKDEEVIWFSPACEPDDSDQADLFANQAGAAA